MPRAQVKLSQHLDIPNCYNEITGAKHLHRVPDLKAQVMHGITKTFTQGKLQASILQLKDMSRNKVKIDVCSK